METYSWESWNESSCAPKILNVECDGYSFTIWTHGEQTLRKFIENLNRDHHHQVHVHLVSRTSGVYGHSTLPHAGIDARLVQTLT